MENHAWRKFSGSKSWVREPWVNSWVDGEQRPAVFKVGLAMRIAGSPTPSSSHPRILRTRPHKVESSILHYPPKWKEEEFYTSSALACLQNSCGRSYCSRISSISRIELSLKRGWLGNCWHYAALWDAHICHQITMMKAICNWMCSDDDFAVEAV